MQSRQRDHGRHIPQERVGRVLNGPAEPELSEQGRPLHCEMDELVAQLQLVQISWRQVRKPPKMMAILQRWVPPIVFASNAK